MATEKRLIDAEALKKAIRMWPRTKQPTLFYIGTIIRGIEEAPTVDAVEVVHGRWVEKKRWSMGKWQKWLECSECGYQDHDLNMYEDMPFTAPGNYCPNCGAKMDGDGDG